MARPKVTVLLPAYNEAKLLPTALESILRDAFTELELLVVDDGSSDESPAVLDDFCARDARLRVLRTKHLGLARALSLGLTEAKGELLLRMDADDISLNDRVARQVAAFEAEPALGLLAGQVVGESIDGAPLRGGMSRYIQWQNSLLAHQDICQALFIENPMVHPCIAARTSLLRQVGGYRDGDFPEDYDLLLRLLIKDGVVGAGARSAKLSGAPLLCWRDRSERFTRTSARCRPEAFRRLKVEHLRRSYLQKQGEVVVWGAGIEGKPFARELVAQGFKLRAFLEIDPRKIGQKIYGAPVLSLDDIAFVRGCFVLGAVGAPQARALMRQELPLLGLTEGLDFCFVV